MSFLRFGSRLTPLGYLSRCHWTIIISPISFTLSHFIPPPLLIGLGLINGRAFPEETDHMLAKVCGENDRSSVPLRSRRAGPNRTFLPLCLCTFLPKESIGAPPECCLTWCRCSSISRGRRLPMARWNCVTGLPSLMHIHLAHGGGY